MVDQSDHHDGGRTRQDHRGTDGPARGTDALAVERVTDGHVALHGECEDEQWTEMLCGQEQYREHLAKSRPLEQCHVPFRLQLKEYLTHTVACSQSARTAATPTQHTKVSDVDHNTSAIGTSLRILRQQQDHGFPRIK